MTCSPIRIYALPPREADVRHVAAHMRPWDVRELEACRGSPEIWAEELIAAIPYYVFAYAICERPDEPAIAFVGLVPGGTPGVAAAHMFATKDWRRIIRPLTAFIRDQLIPAGLDLGLRRVEARALASYSHVRRWMSRLGAVEECVLPGYGRGGEDFVQYAWRRENVWHTRPASSQPQGQHDGTGTTGVGRLSPAA